MTAPRTSIRAERAGINGYTKADELNASPKRPAAPGVHAARINHARAALAAMERPETATVLAWSILCMAGNVLETMLQQQLVQDPDGLLQDAFDALKRAAEGRTSTDAPVIMPPADLALVRHMVDDWAEVITAAPARAVIRAFRATDRRITDIEAGRTQPHDLTVLTVVA